MIHDYVVVSINGTGQVVPPETAYMDEPWEIEAYGTEKELYTAYREYEANLKD